MGVKCKRTQTVSRRAAGVVLVLAAAVSGCASLTRNLEAPTVSLVELRLLEAGIARQRYALKLNVANPNPVRLPVGAISYAIELAGKRFADGTTPSGFSIPARGETQFDVEVSTDLIATAQHLASFLRSGADQLDYSMNGTIDVDLPFVEPLPFARAGAIRLTTQ